MQWSNLHATEWGADDSSEADWSSAVIKGVAGRAHADTAVQPCWWPVPLRVNVHRRGCQYFPVNGIFNKAAFILLFLSAKNCCNLPLTMGPKKLNRLHWFDYPFFMCQHVSTSTPMFPNPVDLNLQWICCWFSATVCQLKSFCRSPLSKELLNQWISKICLRVMHRPLSPLCMHPSRFCIHCP